MRLPPGASCPKSGVTFLALSPSDLVGISLSVLHVVLDMAVLVLGISLLRAGLRSAGWLLLSGGLLLLTAQIAFGVLTRLGYGWNLAAFSIEQVFLLIRSTTAVGYLLVVAGLAVLVVCVRGLLRQVGQFQQLPPTVAGSASVPSSRSGG